MDDINKRLCELLDAEPKELTQSRDEWERLTLKAKAGFEGLLADYLDAAADRRREYGYSQQTVDALTVERDKLEAENRRLREALKGLVDDVEDYEAWQRPCYALDKAREALKEASHEGAIQRSPVE